MKKALISPNETVLAYGGKTGWRVAQVEFAENIFPVADPLFWTDCSDDIVADQFIYDESVEGIIAIPLPPVPEIGGAPNVIA